MSNHTNTSGKRPTHRLFNVTKDPDGKGLWTEIGAAWPHKDGQGFSLKLTTAPGVGDLVLRAVKAKKGGAQ